MIDADYERARREANQTYFLERRPDAALIASSWLDRDGQFIQQISKINSDNTSKAYSIIATPEQRNDPEFLASELTKARKAVGWDA